MTTSGSSALGRQVAGPEYIRELYAVAATKWMADGKTAQYVVVPDDAEMVDAWFRLGLGRSMRTPYARRRWSRCEPLPPRPGLTVRRARRDDIQVLAELDLVLPQHQGLSPVFSSGEVPTLEEALADWEELIDDRDYATFVAERNGEVIGSSIGCSIEKSSTHGGVARPDNAGFLAYAAVFPQARGLGAGRAWVRQCSTGQPRSVTPPS